MRLVSEAEQAALLEVLKRNEARLFEHRGVHYVDVGYKFVDGVPTDQLAIRAHVGAKRPEAALDATELLPKSIDGVPVDVIQSNPRLEQNRDARFDPLVGGTAVGTTRHPFLGTLGVVVFDAVTGAAMGLSNHHVLVSATGQVGDPVVQPAQNDPANIIGTVARWNIGLDCAVCTLQTTRAISTSIVDFPGGVAGARPPLIGMAVAKSGRTTGTTRGIIDGVSPLELTVVPDPAHPAPNGEISAGGDSGSVWLEVSSSRAIGLHYAGETDPNPAAERAWAKRMVNVLNALNVRLARPTHVPVYAQGDPGNGIGHYDLRSPADRALAFDYDHSGKLDHLVLYRPGRGAIFIVRNVGGVFTPVFAQGDPGAGIGGFDLRSPADRAFAFDFDGSGCPDHLVFYRPGRGAIFILRNSGGVFTPVFAQGDPGTGLGGFNLHSPADRAFAFDFDSSGKLDHIVFYRPGTGAIFIVKNSGGLFTPVFAQGDPGAGIGGYDLRSPADRGFAFDFDGSGKLDHLVFYRPGSGAIAILKNNGGTFSPVFAQAGIGGFDLRSPADRAFAVDFDGSGKLDHLAFYRPGTGCIAVMKRSGAGFASVLFEGDPGNGIGGYDLLSPADRALAFDFSQAGTCDHLMLYRPGRGAVFVLRKV